MPIIEILITIFYTIFLFMADKRDRNKEKNNEQINRKRIFAERRP